jgi:sugar phosphate isomerase/epimerase
MTEATISFKDRPIVAGSTLALPDRHRSACTGGSAAASVWSADLAKLRRSGFEAIDLVDTWLSPGELGSGELAELRAVISGLGLTLTGISVIRKSIIDPRDGAANLEHTQASIDAAVALGAPLVCIGFHRPLTAEQSGQWPFWSVDAPGDERDAVVWQLAVTRLREVCQYAAERGIQVSLELYEQTLLGSGADAARLVNDVGAPNLGLNPDLANLYREPRELGETWQETLRRSLPHMNYWHVKNFGRAPVWPAGPFVTFPTAMADGDIDYAEAFRMAASAGYPGPICIEHYGGDRVWEQRSALRYVTWLLDEMEA